MNNWITSKDLLSERGKTFRFRFKKQRKKHTNAERIRAMTDEELARWIVDELIEPGYYTGDEGYNLWLDWLKQEVIQ